MSTDRARPSPERQHRVREIVRALAGQNADGVVLTDTELKGRYPDIWQDVADELDKLRRIQCALDRADEDRFEQALDRLQQDDAGARASTRASGEFSEAMSSDAPAPLPKQMGRFQVQQLLGQGGFGRVYLAWDAELMRHVAIKVPHRHRLSEANDILAFLAEARVLAGLDHPAIVPVYDVGRTEDGGCFVVSKWIPGTNLATRMRCGRLSPCESARIVQQVADALAYAHHRGVVHRDIKPANILLDDLEHPHVVDFGLAVKEEDLSQALLLAGTPAYMSPELVRGETHRLDGRSDLFSLGVVFYELLTGRRPFDAVQPDELLDQILHREEHLPRQWDPSVPEELERICLKLLSKRAADRYDTAKDLSDDLRHFLGNLGDKGLGKESDHGSREAPQPQRRIIPKGLRPFDANDADFFPQLLPGPRDRNGLPEALRQWKSRIEESDPDETFTVGLIYGPSGCGKSSLVRAGLLPRLSPHIQTVYIEATAHGTEERLVRRLIKRFPDVSGEQSLPHVLAQIRRDGGIVAPRKLLLVLDQFEQWLHGRHDEERRTLVEALRQCDGERVQCLLLARDDFWLAISRFMAELEIDLLQGHNTMLVDLFDVQHAKKVLEEFGRAYARLPEPGGELSSSESAFLDRAVTGLAEEGRVISVRLSLFAEMVKDRTWTLATLQEVGGAEGVGVAFLEETFCSRSANPQNRLHERAARAVLESLLPDAGSQIKGHLRSYTDLLDVSGYGDNPRAFKELMRILDSETRLLTPTDPPPGDLVERGLMMSVRYYQLTHDYLVPSLRSWLTKKQQLTRSGRAELRLGERTRLWNARPEARQLPSLWEWLTIRVLTRSAHWTRQQRRMMQVAARRHTTYLSSLAALFLAFLLVGAELSTLAKDSLVWFRASTAPIWLAFGQDKAIWPLMRHDNDPTLRTRLIHRLSSLLIGPDELVKRQADQEDVSIRRAMVLAAGEMGTEPQDSAVARRRAAPSPELVGQLVELYQNDTDPGIHAAAEWTLRRHAQDEAIKGADYKLESSPGDRQWYATRQGHTMVVIPGPVQYLMGSTNAEPGRSNDESPRAAHIRRSFSIANKETTVEQFQMFLRDRPRQVTGRETPMGLSGRAPQSSLTWYDAAAYCNWLSQQEEIPDSQWCYVPNEKGEYGSGMKIKPLAAEMRGYRLPMEVEWEYACRAGASTPWFFGRTDTYLGDYIVWSGALPVQPFDVGRRKPNDFGLFDMLGNVAEWCQDRYEREPQAPGSDREEQISDLQERVVRGGSYLDLAVNVRCAARSRSRSSISNSSIGFRVARSYP